MELKREDDVIFILTELADEALGSAEHASLHMGNPRPGELSKPGTQLPLPGCSEVVQRVQVKILCQVAWHCVKGIQKVFGQSACLEHVLHVIQLDPQQLNLIEQLDLPVEGAVDVLHIEERIIPDLNEQVLGEITDIILAEVPLAQNPAGDNHLGVLMAALTEVLAQVLTVPQPLDIIRVYPDATSCTAVILLGHSNFPRWGWMNIKNYLGPGWGPLQVATNTDTQFVDVSMLPIIW